MKHLLTAIAALAVVTFTTPAAADEIAYSCRTHSLSSTNTIQATVAHSACSGYAVKNNKGAVTQRVTFGFPGSGKVTLAADGKTVVFVNDNPYAGVTPNGTYKTYGATAGRPLYAVAVYRDGTLIKRHLLTDVMHRPRLITATVSHLRWLVGTPTITRTKVSFETTSLRHVEIDLRTGRLSARNTAQWTRCQALAYGNVQVVSGGYTMKPAFAAKGKLGKSIRFATIAGLKLPNGYRTVCLVKRRGKWQARSAFSQPMLNALTN